MPIPALALAAAPSIIQGLGSMFGGMSGSRQRRRENDQQQRQFDARAQAERQQTAEMERRLAQQFGLDQEKWGRQKQFEDANRAALDPARGRALAALMARFGMK